MASVHIIRNHVLDDSKLLDNSGEVFVSNGVVGSSIPVVKSSLYLMEKKTSLVGRKPIAHPLPGRQ